MNVFFTMQGKGGIGNTYVSYLLAQYLAENKEKPLCIDTDQVTHSLASYKALNVKVVDLFENNRIKARKFDKIIDLIMESETDCIIDVGSSNFTETTAYLLENEIFKYLHENDLQTYINMSLVGGKETDDTLKVMAYVFQHYSEYTKSFIWVNPHFAPIDLGGKTITNVGVYKNNIETIQGVIHLPEKSETEEEDILELTKSNLTFDEYINNSSVGRMPAQRAKNIKRKTWDAITIALQGI